MKLKHWTFALAALAITASSATQAAYPERPIRVVVPSAPGSTSDVLFRVLGAQLSKQMGVSVVIEDKPGGSFVLGTMDIVRSAPDGYTVGYGNVTTFAINPVMLKTIPYDPTKDITPIATVLQVRNLMVVAETSPFKNVNDVIAYAKANPGKLSVGSGGTGSTGHLSGELFKTMTGTTMVHVPYKSGPQAANDLIGGQVDLMFENVSIVGPLVQGGKLRALGYTGPSRSNVFPNVPTIAEAGLPGYEMSAWGGLIGPAGLPDDIVKRLDSELKKALAQPEIIERFKSLGVDMDFRPSAGFREQIKSEGPKWADIIKASGATNQ
jgi:tripartite-type tricarboxylate transporter receptor subunit TctC